MFSCCCGTGAVEADKALEADVGDDLATTQQDVSAEDVPSSKTLDIETVGSENKQDMPGDAHVQDKSNDDHAPEVELQPGTTGIDDKSLEQELRAADDAGRVLEAKRLLSEVGAEAAFGEEGAKRIASNARMLAELEQQRSAAKAQAQQSNSGWTFRDDGPMKMYYKYSKWTGEVNLLGDLTLDISPLHLWVILREFEFAPLWLPNCSASLLLQELPGQTGLFKVTSPALVSVLSDTEAIQERIYCDLVEEQGSLVILVEAPELAAESYRGVRLPPCPRGTKRVRQYIRNTLTPAAKDKSCLTLTLKIETPFYMVPDAIVGKVVSLILGKFLAEFQAVYAGWENSEFKSRTTAGPRAAYYSAIGRRLDALYERKEY